MERIFNRFILKRMILLSSCCLLFFNVKSQEKLSDHKSNSEVKTNNDTTSKFTFSEQEAQFPGGIDSLMFYLNHSIHYPNKARRKGKSGKVIVQFQVCSDGKLCDLKIVKSVNELLDEESLRVIRQMPNWKPATMQGKNVPSLYRLPINFELKD